MKLNIGCGDVKIEGYIGVDLRKTDAVDLIHDVSLPFPFQNNTCEDIIADDILEHFSFRMTEGIFKMWVGLLKRGGRIRLMVPNLEAHFKIWQEKCENGKEIGIERMREILYGKQDYKGNTHYTTFTVWAVEDLFNAAGLKIMSIREKGKNIIAWGEK